MNIAVINKKLDPSIETIIVPASPDYNFLASRLVKEVAQFGGDLSSLVPEPVEKALYKKIKK